MYTFYGLVVSFIVFETFIIQSDAMGNNTEKASQDDVKLPYEVLGSILHKAGYNATKGAGRSRALMAASRDGMSRIFEDRILVIGDSTINNDSFESQADGKTYFFFGNYAKLMSLFETYGQYARRIAINYHSLNATIRRDVNKNILGGYAKYFTELRLYIDDDSGIWKEISSENGQIKFPNVKKFVHMCDFAGKCTKSFDLNKIFPKLESLKLIGSISHPDCLANVKNLKELTILYTSTPELQFKDIFANNKQISKLTISPVGTETLQFIEKYLKNLQTLKVKYASDEFWIGGDRLYILPSVKFFVVDDDELRMKLPERLSFKMPNLKKLKVLGEYLDEELSDFINLFGYLDSVEVHSYGDTQDTVKCIEKLANVREHISPFQCSELADLKQFFKTFDKTKSKLSTIKLICLDKLEVGRSKNIMNEINACLKKSNKPTWTLTDGVEIKTNKNYLIIQRNP